MTTSTTATSGDSNYINFHAQGLGYLSRVRDVTVRKGPAFLAASIRAMFGEKGVQDGMQYTSLDVKAVSEQAKVALRAIETEANNPNKRVMVQFRVGDVYIDTFTYQKGEKAGTPGVVLKARLLKIHRAWVKNKDEGDNQQGWVLLYEEPQKLETATEQAAVEQATGTEG